MAKKIMLVEDDANLREIYGALLQAEGYEIVSAADGEDALALAVKEKPDLIISDIMMPKISGFDMLDILRSTPETKDTKVIMMTALSQSEDKARADKLGADRYLVKSQVTLQDVAKVVHELLDDETAKAEQAAADIVATGSTAGAATQTVADTPAPEPKATEQAKEHPDSDPSLADVPGLSLHTTPNAPAPAPADPTPAPEPPTDDDQADTPATDQPSTDINVALASSGAQSAATSGEQERQEVANQINDIVASSPTTANMDMNAPISDMAQPAPELPAEAPAEPAKADAPEAAADQADSAEQDSINNVAL